MIKITIGVEEINFLTIKEVGEVIDLIDPKAIRKWLEENKLALLPIRRRTYVNEFDLNIAITKSTVEYKIRNNPDNWEDLIKAFYNEPRYSDYVISTYSNQKNNPTEITEVKPKSESDKNLLNKMR